MIQLDSRIGSELAEALEAFFCEDYQESWMIEENWKTGEQVLRGYFQSKQEGEAAYAILRDRFRELSLEVHWSELPDRDWKEAYKMHFKPWSERGLHWVPIWERETYSLPEGDAIVYLDPGMAFGTGNHETTRLCVRRLLDAHDEWDDLAGRCLIDCGCGSGILAISGRKLGFSECYGFDNDPDSVRISIENAELCGCPNQIEFKWAGLDEGLTNRQGDLVLANILAPVLLQYRSRLISATQAGGRLILSGILAREVEQVKSCFAESIAELGRSPVAIDSRLECDWADLQFVFKDRA